MLTAEEVQAMTPEERLALIERAGAHKLGDHTVTQLGAALGGYTRVTIYKWRNLPSSIPVAVVMVASVWLTEEAKAETDAKAQLAAKLEAVQSLLDGLTGAVQATHEITGEALRLVRLPRADAAAPDAAASEQSSEA